MTWEKQKQFVADASHELKTPLSIINANYDALLANQDETIKSQSKWLGNFQNWDR
ncbi:histidine kinase dimerization/phospho-acceptor domain-containing protein [Neobacillus sp. PS3-40]|uniref:histidine kinase dimerization/phospho-acceptor domain-containing protein n=1 Tax=Neobacillus sp. PS3-40 TaxID=3070679 RepID=UPI0035A9059B